MAIQNDGGGRSSAATRRGTGGSFGQPTRQTSRRGSGGAFGGARPAQRNAVKSTPNTKPASAPRRAITSGTKIAPGSGSYGGDSGSVSPYSFGGISGGGGAGAMSAMAAPAAPSEEDYLAGDGGYQAALASLKKALEMYMADDTAQRTKYDTDYNEGIKQLGWTPDNPATPQNESAWNWEDQNTASGRAYQNQLNDFASRGMLQSSGYARSNNDLQRSFNDQLGSVNRARSDFLSQRDRDLAAYREENNSANQQARAEAIARRAAQYGL